MSAVASRLAGTGPAACLIVLLFGVAGCGGSSAQTSTETTTTTEETVTTTTAETTTATTTPTKPKPPVSTMRIVVRNGSSVGGIKRVSVKKGTMVTLVVTADLSDHVHLHGYDLMADVAPGRKAKIVFKAKLPGRFEIELEDRGIQIGELEVRP